MNIQKLEELLSRSEYEKLDFKLDFNIDKEYSKREFVKDVTAIANSKGGRGYIIFGVEDKKKEIVGVTANKLEEERIQQLICGRCDPPVPIRFEEIFYKGKKLFVLTIFKSSQRPHQILQTGTFYIRRGSTTDIARRYEVASMLQENGILSYETTILPNAYIDDLDFTLIKKYFSIDSEISSKKNILILEAMGILGRDMERSEYHPTAGGMLLFGKNTQNFLPSTGINIDYNKKRIHIEGNIPSMLDNAENILINSIKNKNYPLNIVLEALYNAVVHRDYWDNTREITIRIEPKMVEIENPGAVWRNEGIINIDSEINPPRRNSWLYQRLLIFDKKQRFISGTLGLKCIKDTLEDIGKEVKFVNLKKKNIFKVVLPGTDEI